MKEYTNLWESKLDYTINSFLSTKSWVPCPRPLSKMELFSENGSLRLTLKSRNEQNSSRTVSCLLANTGFIENEIPRNITKNNSSNIILPRSRRKKRLIPNQTVPHHIFWLSLIGLTSFFLLQISRTFQLSCHFSRISPRPIDPLWRGFHLGYTSVSRNEIVLQESWCEILMVFKETPPELFRAS